MKGPQLTQRKIDKLRDALNVVRECDQVQQDDSRVLWAFNNALDACSRLEEKL